MCYIALLLCCSSFVLAAPRQEWKPTSSFLKALRTVESSDGLYRYGDNGESLGSYQLSEAAWLDVNAWRQTRGLKTYPYTGTVFHAYISREYASNYLSILHSELSRKLRRSPTAGELYAAYNLGLASFAQCKYDLLRVNAVTRARCDQITMLLGNSNSL